MSRQAFRSWPRQASISITASATAGSQSPQRSDDLPPSAALPRPAGRR